MKQLATFIALFFILIIPELVAAGNPPPLFNKPVKLDDSGRPLYNSWERQEYLRKLKLRRKKLKQKQVVPKTQPAVSNNVNTGNKPPVKKKFNSINSAPTPSQSVINRPTQIKGDASQEDADDFNF